MSIRQDIRGTWRTLFQSPYFTIPVLLSLALAIGANVAAFSSLNALVLRHLPVREPHRLFLISPAGDAGVLEGANYAWYERVRDGVKGVSTALQISHMMSVGLNDQVESVHGQMVSGDYFSTLGITPLLGRVVTRADEPGTVPGRVAVISDAYWAARFGRDRSILGKTILIEQIPHEIVGVTRASFFGLQVGRRIDVTIPVDAAEYRRGWLSMNLVVRLDDTLTPGAAAAQLTSVLQDFARSFPARARAARFKRVELEPVVNGLGELRNQYIEPLWALMVIVGTVLLLACANWTTLLMARTSARRREMAIRLALGSTRAQLARRLLIESLMLSLGGASFGFLAAWWGTDLLESYVPENGLPVDLQITPDLTVLLFTIAVAVVTGILFGVGPAWLTRAIDARDLRTTGATEDVRRSGLSRGLVVVQVALSLFLVIAATFFAATLRNLRSQDMGFVGDGVLTLNVDAEDTGLEGEPLRLVHQQVLDRLRALPGARSVTLATITPLSGNEDGKPIAVPGAVPQSSEDQVAQVNTVASDYFTTFGIPILKGRGIVASDREGSPRVAVIGAETARHHFPGADPIGQRLEIGGSRTTQVEIVGVAKDVMYHDLRSATRRVVYVPFTQREAEEDYVFAIRTGGNPDALVRRVQSEIRAIGPKIQVLDVKTLSRQIDERLADERLLTMVSAIFGGLALLLAGIGIYGTVAYAVARRTAELGLRVALGADRGHVLWLVVRGTLVVTALGIVLGLVTAVAASNMITSILFGLQSTDSRVYVAAIVCLSLASILAIIPPVLRALRIQPVIALRTE